MFHINISMGQHKREGALVPWVVGVFTLHDEHADKNRPAMGLGKQGIPQRTGSGDGKVPGKIAFPGEARPGAHNTCGKLCAQGFLYSIPYLCST